MTYQEKLSWLERLFSDDRLVREQAREERVPQPLFGSGEELGKAIKELLARRERKEDTGE
jgi:hypothetical protein